jgi:predicted transcriptional regulator
MSQPESKHEMLSSIVAAYAARNDVTADDIVALVAKLRVELGLDDEPTAAAPAAAAAVERAEPALPLEKAVTEDKVFCLCCGKGFKMLKRHLGAEHGLTEAEYRAMFDLPADFALVAPAYSRKKASHAKQAGFGKYDRGVQKQDTTA